jgi:hypothetical protein
MRVYGQDAVGTAHRFSTASIASVLVGISDEKAPKENTDVCGTRHMNDFDDRASFHRL